MPTGKNGILFTKLRSPTAKKKCSNDQEIILKLKAEGREYPNILKSQTVKGQYNF